jgi:orotidine-5'-phosphate decarboxylase
LNEGIARPLVIAVTALTSANAGTLEEVGNKYEPAELVSRLAVLAEVSGMDGVVASPHEVGIVRTAVTRPSFVVITPGIRPSGAGLFDQKRVTTPRDAILAGADYLVVGRPILSAVNPAEVAQQILLEMETATANSAAI